jgi:hypothetical protein
MPRTSELLDKDPVRLSKLLGENMKMNAKVSFGEVGANQFLSMDEDISGGEPSAAGNEPRERR